MFVLAVQTEIFDTGYCWIVHLSFLTSHNLLFFRFRKTSKKTTFSVFLSFFLVKSPKSQSLKLNISRTAWPILMILVSFCRILNGLSDEINLFWRCSSPLNNYRPISVLPTIARIFERLLYNQLYDYLTANKLLGDEQYGFRSLHSTAMALGKMSNQWLMNMDSGNLSAVVFLDIRKAFGTVDHTILL